MCRGAGYGTDKSAPYSRERIYAFRMTHQSLPPGGRWREARKGFTVGAIHESPAAPSPSLPCRERIYAFRMTHQSLPPGGRWHLMTEGDWRQDRPWTRPDGSCRPLGSRPLSSSVACGDSFPPGEAFPSRSRSPYKNPPKGSPWAGLQCIMRGYYLEGMTPILYSIVTSPYPSSSLICRFT